MKSCIVISDSFKGSLSSAEICAIASQTIPAFFPDCHVTAIPVADGGEGTVDCFLAALPGERRTAVVQGPFGEPVEAAYALIGEDAVVEMAAAAGLPLAGSRLDPATASTYGVGQLIADAISRGARRILLGLGGSATNDGGCGAAAALGAEFYDETGARLIPAGGTLARIARVELSGLRRRLSGVQFTVMCDVDNPLCGPAGAAAVFAPQKGADERTVRLLDDGLRHLAEIVRSQLGVPILDVPGAGAAGGMGGGCLAFFGAALRPGIECILDLVRFDELLAGADLVLTGEGRIDAQSVHGKVISGIARRTSRAGVPLVALVGCIDDSAEAAYSLGVTAMFSIDRTARSFSETRSRSAQDYRAALCDILRLIRTYERR